MDETPVLNYCLIRLRPEQYDGYGVNLLMRVDQLASAVRVPGAPAVAAHVPSKLSPVPPVKNGPPQVV